MPQGGEFPIAELGNFRLPATGDQFDRLAEALSDRYTK